MKKTKRGAPTDPTDWRSNFQSASMRTSFVLALTQPMIEFLCATADGVHWDRTLYFAGRGAASPDCFIASAGALVKRGLISRAVPVRPVESIGSHAEYCETHPLWNLTPAGEALVALLKVAGIFVVADSSIAKAARR